MFITITESGVAAIPGGRQAALFIGLWPEAVVIATVIAALVAARAGSHKES